MKLYTCGLTDRKSVEIYVDGSTALVEREVVKTKELMGHLYRLMIRELELVGGLRVKPLPPTLEFVEEC